MWEVTALYVGEEKVGANLKLSNYMTSIMDITNLGLFFGFWTVSIYGENKECKILKPNKD